jgi:alkylhydroperoxidase/carboxymuconolactone decarboxylase family protein YurZ
LKGEVKMAKYGEEKIVEGMKKAKTAAEMYKSWGAQRPGFVPPQVCELGLYIEKKPEMVFTFAHNALTQLLDHGILEPKTRYLIILACYIMEKHWEGILPQCCNAKACGATEEEIMEVAFITCYAVAKAKNVDTSLALAKAFESPVFKDVKKRDNL